MNLKTKILVIDDDKILGKTLKIVLSMHGYDVCYANSGSSGIQKAFEYKPDLILCDVKMGSVNGYRVYNFLKDSSILDAVPFIFITACNEPKDFRIGMDLGADDYITKPFNIQELLARVKSVIKRSSNDIEVLKVRDIVYNFSSKTFCIEEKDIELTSLETTLLLEFIKNKNILLSREYLLEKVWQDSFDKQEKTVNVAIKRLKDKIDPNSKKNYIKSVRGERYIFC